MTKLAQVAAALLILNTPGLVTSAPPNVPAPTAATAPATRAAQAAAAFNEAVAELTAEDFTDREKASEKLQAILVQQLKAQAQLQETIDKLTDALAAQMKVLGSTKDPEVRARVAAAEFGRDGNGVAEFSKNRAAFGVGRPFGAFGCGPFAVSGHSWMIIGGWLLGR